MTKFAPSLVLVVLLGLPSIGSASEKQVEMRWSELGQFLSAENLLGREQAMLMLPDGNIVQGKIVEVGKDELVLKVTKSSDKQAHPKGRSPIPRSSVKTIRITRSKGPFRGIGTLAGILGGLTIAGLYALSQDEGATKPEAAGILAVLVGLPVGGYYAGRPFDRKTIVIKVLPD